jgi:hypothetical protein
MSNIHSDAGRCVDNPIGPQFRHYESESYAPQIPRGGMDFLDIWAAQMDSAHRLAAVEVDPLPVLKPITSKCVKLNPEAWGIKE